MHGYFHELKLVDARAYQQNDAYSLTDSTNSLARIQVMADTEFLMAGLGIGHTETRENKTH